MTPAPLLVDLNHAAKALSISRRSVQQLIYDGQLPSVKIGRCRRIATVSLEHYVRTLVQAEESELTVVPRRSASG